MRKYYWCSDVGRLTYLFRSG